jgi:N-acetylneuraminic acid mutarotase
MAILVPVCTILATAQKSLSEKTKNNTYMKASLLLLALSLTFGLQAQEWEQLNDIPFSGRHHHIPFTFNGKGYALTGTTEDEEFSREFWEYTPETDTWVQLDDYPGFGRTLGIGDVYDGKFYFGFGNGPIAIPSARIYNDLWVYDPADGSFTQLPSCPCEGRGHPAFVAHNGKIFMGGGSGQREDLKDWWIYDIATQEWTQGPDIPGGRRHHPFMFAIGDYIYVGGGHDVNWSRFDPATNSWMGINNLPEGRVAGTQFSYEGKGYILSGHEIDHSDIPVRDHFMEYDPELDEWTRLPPHPETTRWVPASFVINGYVYMFGGTNRFPPTGTWAKTAYRYPLGEVMVDTDEPELEGLP